MDIPRNANNKYEFSKPRHPQFGNFNDKLLSFENNWPNQTDSNTRKFANAGFFYLGPRDRVKCFYCNGVLLKWKKNDDPWFEHAKWFPTCGFVIGRKGKQYVQDVLHTAPSGSSTYSTRSQRVVALPCGQRRRNRRIRDVEPTNEGHLQRIWAQLGSPYVVVIAIICLCIALFFGG